ncbi:hypothetical protein ACQWU4_16100 [Chryseobacterium sp. MIQD13]|uniref:hypothetical protein n=1 Tax=Chryseobacterium sp. MIQD13 TaxID=3422310 RepID=UPI003D2A57B6
MKKLILIVCLVVVWIFFNYPVFDSKGISYLIIFSCFVILCFAGAKLYTADEKYDYESVEREMDELSNFNGIFQYTDSGFYINREKSSEFIKWDDIISINSFSIPLVYRRRTTGLEIITDSKSYEFDDENTPGIEKLINELYNHLQMNGGNLTKVRMNNHGLEKMNLFKKNGIIN